MDLKWKLKIKIAIQDNGWLRLSEYNKHCTSSKERKIHWEKPY